MNRFTRVGLVAAGCVLVAATAWAGGATFQGFDVVNVVVNGTPLHSDVPAVNFYGRTVLPVRAVAEAAGMDVSWDDATNTATLTSKVDVSALQAENTKLKAQLAAAQTPAPPPVQPAPPSVVGPKLSVTSYAVRKDSIGTVWVYALVKNSGDAPAYEPQISMTAMKDGQVVATGQGSLSFFAVLNAGQTAGVRVMASNDIPAGATFDWAVSGEKTTRTAPKLTLTGSNLTRDQWGNVTAVGTIRNDDTAKVKGVQAVVAFLNAKGEILCQGDAYAALSDLDAGQTTSFHVDTTFKSSEVTAIQIYITGYTM